MMLRFVLTVVVFIPIVLASPFTEKKAAPPVSLAHDELLKNEINDAANAAAFNRLLSHIANVNEERLKGIKKLASLQSINPYPGLSGAFRSNIERGESDSSESDSDSDDEKVVYLVIPDTTALEPESPQTNVPENPPVVLPIVRKVPDNPPIAPQVPLLLPNNTDIIKISPLYSRTAPAQTPLKAEKKTHKKRKEVQKIDYYSPKPQNASVNVSLNKDGWEFLRQSIERSCKSREGKKCRRACEEAVANACSVYDCRKKLKKSLKKNCKRSCKDQFNNNW